jgi:hypothetical protein
MWFMLLANVGQTLKNDGQCWFMMAQAILTKIHALPSQNCHLTHMPISHSHHHQTALNSFLNVINSRSGNNKQHSQAHQNSSLMP